MKKELVDCVKTTYYKTMFKMKKHSPEILMVTGVIGVVVGTVMACKATTKLEGAVSESPKLIKDIKEAKKEGTITVAETGEVIPYSDKDAGKDLLIVYARTGFKVAKLYAPAVTVSTFSLGCMIASYRILTKRNIAIAAAYAATMQSFKDYRARVVERFGHEVDRELKYNVQTQTIEEVVKDGKGRDKIVKKEVKVLDPSSVSEYARFFDESCKGHWDKDPEQALYFLKCQQNYANDLLKCRKHLYLNEVYDMLGMERSKAGQIVGWVFDENSDAGDNFVDFGIYNYNIPGNSDFVNGLKPVVLLDFNVDGNILDLM